MVGWERLGYAQKGRSPDGEEVIRSISHGQAAQALYAEETPLLGKSWYNKSFTFQKDFCVSALHRWGEKKEKKKEKKLAG